MDFLLNFSQLVLEINNLLGMSFVPDKTSFNHPVGILLQQILINSNSEDIEGKNLNFNVLRMFVKHLREVKNHDLKLFHRFRKRIVQANLIEHFIGIRFELEIAASLIRKELNFTKSDPPDFCVSFHDATVYIECRSMMLTSPGKGDLLYKLSASINAKSRKDYSNSHTAFFIDMTNIDHHSFIRGIDLEKTAVQQEVFSALSKTSYGSALIFTHGLNEEKQTFESVYIRIDNSQVASDLCRFLDECYSFGNYVIPKFVIPEHC
ncbi:MAG: hypothetical protein HYS55_03315 [Candidatus Omnitrophica bacterium]|nr:hypothetical protein [Candidatus Omnitrophota bacterium]